jgi:hypothetical protein
LDDHRGAGTVKGVKERNPFELDDEPLVRPAAALPERPPDPEPPEEPAAAQVASPQPRAGAGADTANTAVSEPAMTPAQLDVFDNLLEIGSQRPVAPAGLVDQLRARLTDGIADAMSSWGQPLWFSKSMLTETVHCEGLVVANATRTQNAELHPATMTGIVAHRAIQIACTHPAPTPAQYVREAVRAARNEEKFAATWEGFGDAERSDLVMSATSKVIAFLDSFPVLRDEWSWRFEESFHAKIDRATFAARSDLTLGRPKADGRQTMVFIDLKTGALNDSHPLEASFYALVAALRWGIPPWRSCVYSLASGEWTDPDVTPSRLTETVDTVIAAVNARVQVLNETRAPALTPGVWCRYCPAAADCEAYAAERAAATAP